MYNIIQPFFYWIDCFTFICFHLLGLPYGHTLSSQLVILSAFLCQCPSPWGCLSLKKEKIKLVIHCSNSLPDSIRFLFNLLDKHECSSLCLKKSLEFTKSLVPSMDGYNSHFWTLTAENTKLVQLILTSELINIVKLPQP